MLTFSILIDFVLLISIKSVICDEETLRTVEVTLKQGVLSGTVNKTLWKEREYYSFQGIPYAEPPLGELRFQPPKPLQKWDGTYEAYRVKPTCLQFSSRNRNDEESGYSGSEDCLYLSVFTTSLEGNKPVIVFDYNDNFRTGFNGTDTYAPDFFIEGDVIIVFITNRIGIMGYLTTEDDVIPANNGVRDFILGLKWIQDNIERFGGDPKRVTLMGNRGGAVIAEILLYSKSASGLFTAVILHSGTAMESSFFYDNARQRSFDLGAKVNVTAEKSKELLEALQKMDAQTLIQSEIMLHDGKGLETKQISDLPFAPIIETDHENAVITVLPEKGKIVNDVPVLIGMTSREGLDLASHYFFDPKLYMYLKSKKLLSMHFPIRVNYRFNAKSSLFKKNVTEDILNYYHGGVDNKGYEDLLEYAEFIGDMTHMYALNYAAKKIAKDLESPVYYFVFDFMGLLNENFIFMAKYSMYPLGKGATVTDELCYLFVCSRLKRNYFDLKNLLSEQPEQKVVKRMVRLWSNFAKTRNPTPEKDDLLKRVTWKPIDKNSKDVDYLLIRKVPKMNKHPLGTREQFWDEFLQKYAALAVNGVVGEGDIYEEEEEEVEPKREQTEEEVNKGPGDPNDVIILDKNYTKNQVVGEVNVAEEKREVREEL